MQQLHKNNTPCHAELITEPSRSAASHHTSIMSFRANSRSLHLIIPRSRPYSIFYSLFSIFLTLFSIPATAQPYQWDWATYGGSDLGDNGWYYRAEQVYDVVVGSDNNYYFLANIRRSSIGSSGSQLAGQPVTVYNNYATSWSDIFLFSTTCDGTVRWSQAIGGGGWILPIK